MKIKKMYQGTAPENKILNTQSESQTDVYSCDYINKLNTYSTEETIIGTWIDGKPLYRKTLTFNTTINSNTPLYIAHNISNVDTIFVDYSHSYFWNDTVGSYSLPIVGYDGGFTDTVYCIVNKNDVVVCSTGGWGESWRKHITIKYTKTTD